MKKAKRIVSFVLVLMFTMSLGYFATLTPTGAWLYDFHNEEKGYQFDEFDVSNGKFTISEDITFEATTKINDENCNNDFNKAHDFTGVTEDKIVYKEDITVYNSGDVPARIYVNLDGGILNPENSAQGREPQNKLNVSYFFYLLPETETSIRDTMESKLTALSGDTEVTDDNRLTVLEDYQKSYVTIPAPTGGEAKTEMTLRVLFWVDHDIVGETLEDTDNLEPLNTDARIILTAIQDTDNAIGDILPKETVQ